MPAQEWWWSSQFDYDHHYMIVIIMNLIIILILILILMINMNNEHGYDLNNVFCPHRIWGSWSCIIGNTMFIVMKICNIPSVICSHRTMKLANISLLHHKVQGSNLICINLIIDNTSVVPGDIWPYSSVRSWAWPNDHPGMWFYHIVITREESSEWRYLSSR